MRRLGNATFCFVLFSAEMPCDCHDVWAGRRNLNPLSSLEQILLEPFYLFQNEHTFFCALLVVGFF